MSEQTHGDLPAILLVDDNPMDVLVVKTVIEAAGDFQVIVATDGNAGEALIQSREWAVAVIDLVLPGVDGVEVIQAGRKKHPDLPIIFVSASSNDALIDAAFRAGADHRITKPVDPEEMLAKIREHMAPVESENAPTVVAVGASPGDIEMGCGGVLCKHRSEGHRIVIVNLAGGGDPHSRLSEGARLAADLLDAEMENMGEDPLHVTDLDGATAALENVFKTATPGLLYVPTVSSDRPSSVETHRVALALAEAVPNILAYQDPGATMEFRPRLFVDLSPQLDCKLELVAQYDRLSLPNVSAELAKATALYWGRFADPTLAEPLEIIRRPGG